MAKCEQIDGEYLITERDEFTDATNILGSSTVSEEAAWESYRAGLPKPSCDLENPHLCESCQ